jgi:uncharacterized repeat protein (TIGR03803 family)
MLWSHSQLPRHAGRSEIVLYSFCPKKNCSDEALPYAGVISDKKGNLYGTTNIGGTGTVCRGQGCGTAFKVTPRGQATVFYSFAGGSHGATPFVGVIADSAGQFVRHDVLWRHVWTALYSFTGGSDGG